MKKYLETLITEKGRDLDEWLRVDAGHINLTWHNVIEFICNLDLKTQAEIRNKLVLIDFKNGDVFHFLNYILDGMLKVQANEM